MDADLGNTDPSLDNKRRRTPQAKGESTNPPTKHAVWKLHEEAELVHSLLEVKHAGGTLNIGFKDKVWNSVSAHLTEECGTVFEPSACKNKYGKTFRAVRISAEQ
ncbi:uncharacterized protein EI90DRAFT_3022449 [Cantharellus anzutake]|uniref:uncharacterized protein n=1 Tax=Cantharellus anzutake TaxID=1750568 RepID=UPI001906927D|nr:uncharacterized protein EI90DRAFT_3022449 [Cantharellus anzutake]KAF8314137.1 hypothetical protein EI90DRAFT_3022449 [Cantharellus anzutake]